VTNRDRAEGIVVMALLGQAQPCVPFRGTAGFEDAVRTAELELDLAELRGEVRGYARALAEHVPGFVPAGNTEAGA
jgi:hypothetical protein